MSKTVKRVLSLVLCAAVLLGVAPLNGFVGLHFPELKLPSFSSLFASATYADNNPTSGTCGDNLTWEYDTSTATLTISGTGEMNSYDYDVGAFFVTTAPWGLYYNRMKNLVINSGATNIGSNAFHGCNKLTSLSISDSVTLIGDYAFCRCTALSNVTIPDTVTYIYSDAFWLCTGLKEVTIGKGVQGIGHSAFRNCNSLESLTVDKGNSVFHSSGNCIIHTSRKELWIGCKNSIIPSDGSVTKIGDSAFEGCTGLTSVTIPDNVTSIGSMAFYDCTGLTSIIIPDSVRDISVAAFNNTAYYNQSSNWQSYVLYICNHLIKAREELSGDYSIKSGTICIASYAFSGCPKLTKISIPDSVESIGYGAFSQCEGLSTAIIPDSVKYFGGSMFFLCTGLEKIIIPSCVTSISRNAFWGCTGLTSVTIPDSVTIIGEYAFRECTGLTKITIPNSVTQIVNGAFCDCTGLTSINIPSSIVEIDTNIFYGCTGLKSVNLPDSITRIRGNAFKDCTKLTDVYYQGTEAQWKKVFIDQSGNNPLFNATIHYNSTGGDIDPPGPFGDYGVTLEQDKYKTTLDETFDIKVTNLYLPTHEAGELIWESSDESVSIIPHDKYATVTAEKPGRSVITVTSHGGGYSAKCIVFVGDRSLVIGKQGGFLEVGKEQGYMISLCNAAFVNMSDNKTVGIDHAYASAEEISEISFTIADQSIATVSSTSIDNGVIELKVKGISEGVTYFTVTYTETGEVRYFPICVTNSENTYYINNIPSKKYNDNNTYNFYQSGIYIYNFKAKDTGEGYSNISFDAYNTTGIVGSIDIYNENGDLVGNEMIDSFDFQPTDPIKGMKTLYYLVPAICTLSYNDITKPFNSSQSPISFKLPQNGYFKINNDISASTSCLIYNTVNLTIDSISMFTGLKSTLSSNKKDEAVKEITEQIVDYILKVTGLDSESGAILKTLSKLKDEMLKDAEKFDAKNIFSIMDELCKHLKLNIDYVELVKSTLVNILKSAANDVLLSFDKTGVAKLLYKYQKWENYCTALTDLNLHNGDGSSFVYNIQGGQKRISNGIIFEGSADDVAIFRTYEVSYGEMVDNLNREFAKAKLYDLSLVKNNQLTQPNVTSKIFIPIPFGYNKTGLKVYRINDNGSKTDMNAHIEGNYLVFETDHFSYYAVVEQAVVKVTKVELRDSTVKYKSSITLNPTITADAGAKYTVSYSSSNPSIASVDANGNVTGVKKGTANITVSVTDETGNTVTNACTVTVKYAWWQWLIKIFLLGFLWY